ncbi:Magnesium and cobalt transport protein corA [Bacillus thuringiensis serovar israelensis ATCC 35646]|nr:Magnesium and cobalt transport protein corA [Bacillus thuringiensis serovar israelensis ATCC 35646]
MECIKMTKWSWYHVKTSELEKFLYIPVMKYNLSIVGNSLL